MVCPRAPELDPLPPCACVALADAPEPEAVPIADVDDVDPDVAACAVVLTSPFQVNALMYWISKYASA